MSVLARSMAYGRTGERAQRSSIQSLESQTVQGLTSRVGEKSKPSKAPPTYGHQLHITERADIMPPSVVFVLFVRSKRLYGSLFCTSSSDLRENSDPEVIFSGQAGPNQIITNSSQLIPFGQGDFDGQILIICIGHLQKVISL